MSSKIFRPLICISFVASAAPVLSADCDAAKSAMLLTARTPASLTITKTDAHGKKTVSRMVRTANVKYVQAASGKWYAMNISEKDLDYAGFATAKYACHRSGGDAVNGEPAAVYAVHVENDGTVSDSKIWVNSKNLIVKSELSGEGGTIYSTVSDYAHVTVPANARAIGSK